MTKSELIERIAARERHLTAADIDLAVRAILGEIATALANGRRTEIRGFGSFSLHYRAARIGRNPKTGESVPLHGKYFPRFKAGKKLRDCLNAPHAAASSDGAGTAEPHAAELRTTHRQAQRGGGLA